MKLTAPRRYRRFMLAGLLLALFSGFILGSYVRRVQAICYTPPHSSSLTPRWASEAAVTVIYDENSDFTSSQLASMNTAFANFNASNHPWGNNTGVVFTGGLEGPAPNYQTATNVIHVYKGNTEFASWWSNGSGTYTTVGELEIGENWNVTGNTLTSAIAHEIGHSFRLGDCYPTCNGLSVMGSGGVYGPN